MTKPFRFSVTAPPWRGSLAEWQADRRPGILTKIRRRFCLVRAAAEKIGKN